MKNVRRTLGAFFTAVALMLITMPGSATTYACYDSWDDPSWFRDDYNARVCTPCSYVRGHDFGDTATCEPSPGGGGPTIE